MKTRNTIWLGMALILASAGGVLALLAGAPPVPEIDNEARHDTLSIRWVAGQQQAYALRVVTEVDLGRQAGQDGGDLDVDQILRQEVSGTLNMRVVAVEDDRIQVAFRLEPVERTVNGQSDSTATGRLSHTILVEMARTGECRSFQLDARLNGTQREQLVALVRMFQVVVPSGARDQWITVEQDFAGRFKSRYTAVEPGRLTKKRLRYLGQQSGPRTKVLTSLARVDLRDTGSWLRRVELQEALRVRSGGQVVASTLRARLELLDGQPVTLLLPETAMSRMPASARPQITRQHSPSKAPAAARPATAEDRARFQQLVAAMDAREGKLPGALDRLRDQMLAHPELALMVPGMVGGGLSDLTASTLIHALRLAGHGPAQTALAKISADPAQQHQNRLRAVIDLGGVEAPTTASCEALWLMFEQRWNSSTIDLSNTAILALGRIGNTTRDPDSRSYLVLRGRMVGALDAANGPEQTAMVLTAMGNTADTELVETVTGHLTAVSAQVRAAAAKALGRMGSQESVDQLTDSLIRESSPHVRGQIAQSLERIGSANLRSLQLVGQQILGEGDERARFAMARYLSNHIDEYAPTRETLARLLDVESSNRIRAHVAGCLYRNAR